MPPLRTTTLLAAAVLSGCSVSPEPSQLDAISHTTTSEKTAEALTVAGTVQAPWGPTVQYTTHGTPADTPVRYQSRIWQPSDGTELSVTVEPEWQRITLAMGESVATFFSNPDGTYSLDGQTFASIAAAGEALAVQPGFAAVTETMIVASVLAMQQAFSVASTRIPDGWCDPFWFDNDPDCPPYHGVTIADPYACARWGEESASCQAIDELNAQEPPLP